MPLDDQQKEALSAPLNRAAVKTRTQGKSELSYIEGWHAIAEANRIFGFDAWSRETIDIGCVFECPRKIHAGKPYEKDGFGVTYTAKVRVTIDGVVREGVGAGHGIDVDAGQAHESAIKEAETDAMKRALMTFGNPFGLALYDKKQANVEDAPKQTPKPGDGVRGAANSRDNLEARALAISAELRACTDMGMLIAYWPTVQAELATMKTAYPAGYDDVLKLKDKMKANLTDPSEQAEREAIQAEGRAA